jgi:hypothetical protein
MADAKRDSRGGVVKRVDQADKLHSRPTSRGWQALQDPHQQPRLHAFAFQWQLPGLYKSPPATIPFTTTAIAEKNSFRSAGRAICSIAKSYAGSSDSQRGCKITKTDNPVKDRISRGRSKLTDRAVNVTCLNSCH